jgi:hypothetical protein
MPLDGKEKVYRPKLTRTRSWTTSGIESLPDLMGADPPARPVAVAPHRHDELTLLRRTAGQRPGHAHPEPLGLGRSPDSVVVPRSRPVLDYPQDAPGQPELGVPDGDGHQTRPEVDQGRSFHLVIRTYNLSPSRLTDCLEACFRQESACARPGRGPFAVPVDDCW